MNFLGKMFQALKNGTLEMGESTANENTVAQFELEISTAQQQLDEAKRGQRVLNAHFAALQTQIKVLQSTIGDKEIAVREAMAAGQQSKAREMAQVVADLINEKRQKEQDANQRQQQCAKLDAAVDSAQSRMLDMQSHLSQVKTTEIMLKAQEALMTQAQQDSNPVVSAKQSLSRIRSQQAQHQATLEASQMLQEGSDLEKRLKEAGIIETEAKAEDVLQRLQKESQEDK